MSPRLPLPPRRKLTAEQERLVSLIRELSKLGPPSQQEIADRLGISKSATKQRLDVLQLRGIVAYGKRGASRTLRLVERPKRVEQLADVLDHRATRLLDCRIAITPSELEQILAMPEAA